MCVTTDQDSTGHKPGSLYHHSTEGTELLLNNHLELGSSTRCTVTERWTHWTSGQKIIWPGLDGFQTQSSHGDEAVTCN